MTDIPLSRRTTGATTRHADFAWRQIDFLLLSVTGALALLGVLMISSATSTQRRNLGLDPYLYVKRQLIYVAVGIVVLVVITLFDYRMYCDLAHVLYVGTFALLAGVLVFGSSNKGARSWFEFGFVQFQPSEIAKITTIVALATYGAAQRNLLDARRLLKMLGLVGVPAALIYLEPDLGTALVFLAIVVAMVWVAGAQARHVAYLGLAGIMVVVIALRVGALDPYQIERLFTFVNPGKDVADAGFNVTQSKIAIGAGGLAGRGLFRGTQTTFGYVPEQRTDFIFTAVGEQLGLVGGAMFLFLFAIMAWRIWRTAAAARDGQGTLICVGVLAMLMFQIFENIGMTMGIMPVTGIPLPFLSFGGSSTLATFLGLGLVLNVGMYRFR